MKTVWNSWCEACQSVTKLQTAALPLTHFLTLYTRLHPHYDPPASIALGREPWCCALCAEQKLRSSRVAMHIIFARRGYSCFFFATWDLPPPCIARKSFQAAMGHLCCEHEVTRKRWCTFSVPLPCRTTFRLAFPRQVKPLCSFVLLK